MRLSRTKFDRIYNNRHSNTISFMSYIPSSSERFHSELILLLFLQDHRETDRFLHLEEFIFRNLTVTSSTTATPCSPHRSSLGRQHSRQGCCTVDNIEHRTYNV